MKRTAIRRSERPLRARKPGKPRRRAGACRPYLDWLTTQACRLTGKRTGQFYPDVRHWGGDNDNDFLLPHAPRIVVDPAHVRTKRLGGDLYNAISLAHHLHDELHAHGIKTFARKYGVDLEALARRQTDEWLQTPEGEQWRAEHPEFAGALPPEAGPQ